MLGKYIDYSNLPKSHAGVAQIDCYTLKHFSARLQLKVRRNNERRNINGTSLAMKTRNNEIYEVEELPNPTRRKLTSFHFI